MSLERTIRSMYIKEDVEPIVEDGHVDVASAKRQCKTIIEDAQAIMSALNSMDNEGSLPTWWTNKLAVASNSMNKMNDYISNPTEMKEESKVKCPRCGTMNDPSNDKCTNCGLELSKFDSYQKEDVNQDKLLKALKKKLSDEGGAAGMKPLKDVAKEMGVDLTPEMLKGMSGIKQHRDGDYILEDVEIEEMKVRGKEVYDKTFANKTQADNYAKKMGGRVQQVGRVFYVFKEELEEAKRDPSKSGGTGYDLYHKDFSSAMKHAYDYAKKKFGIEIDPKEIDDKVASGPRKPSKGKTNTYRLKGKDGKKAVQIQVANLDDKKFELNMYKESVDLEEAYKTPTEASAYEAGKKAARSGKKYDDNPNKKGSKEYTAWSKGHNEARAKGMKEEVELDEKKDEPPFDVSKADYKGAAKELTDYAMKKGGMDKNDFLGFANRMSAIAGKKSPRVTARFARDLEALDTSPREKIISVMRNNGIKVTMAGRGLKIEGVGAELTATQRLRAILETEVPVTKSEQPLTVGQSIMEKAIARIREAEGEKMTDAEMKKREEIVKELKKKEDDFKERYGDKYKQVMYATATKMAMGKD